MLFATVVFAGAFLLFQVQPLAGKFLLPRFGGSPSVWTACLLFFELVLLAGYAYAHALVRAPPKIGAAIHIGLLACGVAVLAAQHRVWGAALLPGAGWLPTEGAAPMGQVLGFLARSVGIPYLMLSTTGPLIQAWFARTLGSKVPYRLYALSNAGSLLGLLSYPLWVERVLSLPVQAEVWSASFVGFAVGCAACAWVSRHAALAPDEAAASDARPGEAEPTPLSLWLLLAAAPSVMLLATTNRLCQEVAAVPFLWVLPLSIYLLTFIICFDRPAWYHRRLWGAVFIAALGIMSAVLGQGSHEPIPVQVGAYSLMLFALCMVCHGELARLKPSPRHLTLFYLMVAAGGALGGLAVGLVAPEVFRGYWEFSVGLWGTCALLGAVMIRDRDSAIYRGEPLLGGLLWAVGGVVLVQALALQLGGRSVGRLGLLAALVAVGGLWALARRRPGSRLDPGRPLWARLAMGLGLGILGNGLWVNVQAYLANASHLSRNFYGVLRVQPSPPGAPLPMHALMHGDILHGLQYDDPALRRSPTAYYGPSSGVELALDHHPRRARHQPLEVGLIGMGIGTLAAYAHPGDLFRFYEINPGVIRLARGEDGLFSYLGDARGTVQVEPGDGRLLLERDVAHHAAGFDVLVLDAFSGDAIPMHLMTREAFGIYAQALRGPESMIAVHITNRYLDLAPVVARLGADWGFHAESVWVTERSTLSWVSHWMLLTRSPWPASPPAPMRVIHPAEVSSDPRYEWTDDFCNLFSVVRLSRAPARAE